MCGGVQDPNVIQYHLTSWPESQRWGSGLCLLQGEACAFPVVGLGFIPHCSVILGLVSSLCVNHSLWVHFCHSIVAVTVPYLIAASSKLFLSPTMIFPFFASNF